MNKNASKFDPSDPWIEFPPSINSNNAEPRLHKFSYLDINQDIKTALLKTSYKQNGTVRCLCNPQDPQNLSIGMKKGFYLSCYPNTRFKHHLNCPFFGLEIDQTGISAYAKEAINFENGLIDLNLNEKMHLTKRFKKPPIATKEINGTEKLLSISLKGLLHLWFEEAGLNSWKPIFSNYRNYTSIRRRLFGAMSRMSIDEIALRESIYIPPIIYPGSESKYIENSVKGKKDYLNKYFKDPNKSFFYAGVVSECIKSKKKDGRPPFFTIKLKHDRTPIFVHPDTMKEINKSLNGISLSEAINENLKVFIILKTNILKGKYYWAKGGAGTLITTNHIPVQNKVELRFAESLIAKKRYFIKPLLYDASELLILSDFILMDTEKDPCHIYVNHVFGNIDYQRRKFNAKNELMLLHKNSIFWEEDEDIPELPKINVS